MLRLGGGADGVGGRGNGAAESGSSGRMWEGRDEELMRGGVESPNQ